MSNGPKELPATPTSDPAWLLVEEGFNLAREHEIESLFTVSNGYVGTRGALPEGSSLSSPATFVAGTFGVDPGEGSVPALVVAPDWAHVRVLVDGHPLRLEEGEVLEHRRMLDLRQGILWRDWRHRDPAGRVTRLRFLRLASLADRHLLFQSATVTPENYNGRIVLESRIELSEAETDEESPPAGPPLIPLPLAERASSPPGRFVLEYRTAGREGRIALACAGELRSEAGERIAQELEKGEGWAAERWEWEAEIDTTCRIDRLVAVYTSRDAERPADAAAAHLERAWSAGAASLVQAHTRAWAERWKAADVQVEGDGETQQALRLAAYTLTSAANPEDERVSIGARALTGEGYKGHVFWDTEIYMLPFYIFTYPAAARSLLMYRYHTLPAAREKARSLGYRGALFAWESADTGKETTPSTVLAPDGQTIYILTGEQEHHISADVAYGVHQYWLATADDGFFTDAGAEIILETARFWASRGRIEADGRYHIRGVIGPDEYHETVDDNAFTNVMAQWNMERGAEAADHMKKRWPEQWQKLAERLELAEGEPQEWLRLAEAMYTGFDSKTGLFEQFRGYFDLEEIDLAAYEPLTVPIDVLLGRERTQRSKVVKQADVVLLIYLLRDRFPLEVRRANFRYYEPRCGHGSSLSPSIHALVAARLGDQALAEHYFHQTAEIDLADNMGNAASGVHVAALGGLWQAGICGYAGMRPRRDGLALDPHLPGRWHLLRFQPYWRGHRLRVDISGEPVTVAAQLEGEQGTAVALSDAPPAMLAPGHRYVARRDDSGWEKWQETPASESSPASSDKGGSGEPETK